MLAKRIALLPPLVLLCFLGAQCSQHHYRSLPSPHSAFIPTDLAERAARFGLVDIRRLDPSILTDLRYATGDNIVGKPIYPKNMPCLLYQPTARKLLQAQRELQAQGLGLKIWDGYRPPRSHLALWEASPKTGYVVSPDNGFSRHCMGVAVDVTLVDPRGRPVPMPTDFDHFSGAAASNYLGSDPAIRQNLLALQTAMRNAGFGRIDTEWWHFEDRASSGANVIFAKDLGLTLPDNVRNVKFALQNDRDEPPAPRGRTPRRPTSR